MWLIGNRAVAFCVCQREHWECWRPCVQSGGQSKNAPTESWDLMWNSPTDCTQNNLSRSPAQLCQTTPHTAADWNQLTDLPVWLATSSCSKRYSLTSHGLGMKNVHRRTTIQLAEWSGLCISWQQEAIHRFQPSATHVDYGVCWKCSPMFFWDTVVLNCGSKLHHY